MDKDTWVRIQNLSCAAHAEDKWPPQSTLKNYLLPIQEELLSHEHTCYA